MHLVLTNSVRISWSITKVSGAHFTNTELLALPGVALQSPLRQVLLVEHTMAGDCRLYLVVFFVTT